MLANGWLVTESGVRLVNTITITLIIAPMSGQPVPANKGSSRVEAARVLSLAGRPGPLSGIEWLVWRGMALVGDLKVVWFKPLIKLMKKLSS